VIWWWMSMQDVRCGRSSKAEVAVEGEIRSCSTGTTTQSTVLWYVRRLTDVGAADVDSCCC